MGKIVYRKFFALIKERGLSSYKIRQQKIISEGTLTHLRHNKPVSTETIRILCEVLNCQPADIMEYVDE